MPYDHVQNRPVTVALVQMSCTAVKQPNIDQALARIAEAAGRGANVVCLQELFAGLYFCQTEDHRWFAEAEPIPGPTSERLAAAAKKHGVVIIGSLFERRAPGLYHNTAVVFDADGSQAGLYRKMHIPEDPLARHRQRRLHRGPQPRRPRRIAAILGRLVRQRSQWQLVGKGGTRRGANSHGPMRPRPD